MIVMKILSATVSKEYYTKTAEVAELYKKQGKYIEVNGVGEIEEISNKLLLR